MSCKEILNRSQSECLRQTSDTLEPATSAVTDPRLSVTRRNQKARMANFGALGALRKAYRTLIKPSTSALLGPRNRSIPAFPIVLLRGMSRQLPNDMRIVFSSCLDKGEPIHFLLNTVRSYLTPIPDPPECRVMGSDARSLYRRHGL